MLTPNFTITPTLLNNISRISEIKTHVEHSRVLPLNEAQLKREAIVRMAHTSTSIEGNMLAEFEVKKVLAGQKVHADDKSILEVINYQHAIAKVDQLASEGERLTLDKLLSIHQVLMKGLLPEVKSGHFRPGPVYVVDDLGDGEERVRFTAPPAKKVAFLMNELLNWLALADTQELHPAIKAGIFHLHFVTIHPFSDGNGRMARLLTQYVLYRDGWDFRKIIVLENYYNRDRKAYYDAENKVQGEIYNENMDFTSWLEYFTRGFLVEAEKVMESLDSIGYGSVDSSTQVYLDKDEIKIMDFLTTMGRLTSDDVMDVLAIAKRTAQLKLKTLLDKGLLRVEGKGPSTFYTLKR